MDFYYVNIIILVLSFQRLTVSVKATNNNPPDKTYKDKVSWSGKQLDDVPVGNPLLKELDLAYNNILTLPPNVFQNKSYRDLTVIDIHENRVNNISSSAFKGLRNLRTIDLSHNNIRDLDTYTFEPGRKLEKLDLTSNKIKFSKSKVFLMSSSMKTLILTKNDIQELYELTFIGLKHLTNLILDENALIKIHPNSFKPLIDIQFLSLSNTGVIHLGTAMFTQIPRVMNVEFSPLANKFNPPLTRIKKDQVVDMLTAEDYERLVV